MPLLGLLDPSRGAFLWGAWGYTVTFEQLYGEWKAKHITGRDFMRRMGITANTFYRRVRQYEATHGITEQTIT